MDEKLEQQMFLEQVNIALHHSVPDMFWVKDLDGRYIKANVAIASIMFIGVTLFGHYNYWKASK